MQARYLVTGLAVVLAGVTGVLIYQGNQTSTPGSSSMTLLKPPPWRFLLGC